MNKASEHKATYKLMAELRTKNLSAPALRQIVLDNRHDYKTFPEFCSAQMILWENGYMCPHCSDRARTDTKDTPYLHYCGSCKGKKPIPEQS